MKPTFCYYYVTLKCNSKCVFCNIWSDKKNFAIKEQSLSQVKENLRGLKKLGVRFIDFTGGEPLLYEHIVPALESAKKMGFYTIMTTNASFYPKFAEKINGLVDILQFSFDSTDKKEHDRMRGIKSYDSVLKSIKIAKKLKQRISLIHTVTNDNSHNLKKMVKFAQKNRCTLVLNPCFEFFGNKGASKKTVAKIKKYFWEPYVAVDAANLKLIEDGGNNPSNPVCRAVASTIIISPDNHLLLPCYHKSIKKLKISGNLYELYNSDEIKNFKKMDGKFSFCNNCTIYCYIRSSLYRNVFGRYFWKSFVSAMKYLWERRRRQ